MYEYNQLKTLLDGVFNSSWDMTNRNHSNDNTAVNIHYESATARRYRVYFADLTTQETLSLPSGECELILDTDKIVLEQHHDKQYTFPRSTIRTICLIDNDVIEFELGSRAPVQGFIRFRFDSVVNARSCYSQWNEGITPMETSNQQLKKRFSLQQPEYPIIPPRVPLEQEYNYQPPRVPLEQEYNYQPPRPPARTVSTKSPSPYYNTETITTSAPNGSQNIYTAFHTLV